MPSASRTETYEVDLDAFFETIVDYRAYPQFADNVVKTQLIQCRQDGARVKFFIHLIRDFNYTLDLFHDYPKGVYWNLVRGDLFSKMDGAWELERKGKRKLKVTYTVDIEAKLLVPGFIMNQLVSFNLPRVMTNFYERAKVLEAREKE